MRLEACVVPWQATHHRELGDGGEGGFAAAPGLVQGEGPAQIIVESMRLRSVETKKCSACGASAAPDEWIGGQRSTTPTRNGKSQYASAA